MNYVILVSHGQFAKGLHETLNMFVGEKEEVKSIGLNQGEDVASLERRINELLSSCNEAEQFIILADIIGGSPLTTMMNCLQAQGLLSNSVVLGGMNLPMALNAVLMKDDIEQVKTMAVNEAKEAIKTFELDMSEEEEI